MRNQFQDIQLAFIEHIKDPENHPFESGIEDRRMKIYRELFFNNIVGFLNSAFPVLQSLYTEENWLALARNFFTHHACKSPYFIDISKEFVEFLSSEYTLQDQDPLFMQELAHYEWMELAISVRKTQQSCEPWNSSKPVSQVVMSEVAELVSYQYPVHEVSQSYSPEPAPEPVYLVIYRNHEDEVKFSLVNAVSAHLLVFIQQHESVAVDDAIMAMQSALPQIDKQTVANSTQETIELFLRQQILLPFS